MKICCRVCAILCASFAISACSDDSSSSPSGEDISVKDVLDNYCAFTSKCQPDANDAMQCSETHQTSMAAYDKCELEYKNSLLCTYQQSCEVYLAQEKAVAACNQDDDCIAKVYKDSDCEDERSALNSCIAKNYPQNSPSGNDNLTTDDAFSLCLGVENSGKLMSGKGDASEDSKNCSKYETQYQMAVQNEGLLLSFEEVQKLVAEDADYDMALTLNAAAVKKLFESSVSWAKDYPVTIDFDGCREAYLNSNDLVKARSCLSFGFSIGGYDVKFGVPITAKIKRDGEDGVGDRTSVYADLRDALIINPSGNVSLDLAVENAVKMSFGDNLKEYHMFDIAAWEIGNGEIKLFAGTPRVQTDSSGYRALEFGLYSNLLFAHHDSVDVDSSKPQDTELGIHIHPDLIRNIIGRMMTEVNALTNDSFITRSVALSESRNVHVTLADMTTYAQEKLIACDSKWRNYLGLGFTLWSTDAFCGNADLVTGLELRLADGKFDVNAGDMHVGYFNGAMSLDSYIYDKIGTSEFYKAVMNYVGKSVNFDMLFVTDSSSASGMRKAAMNAKGLSMSEDGSLNLYLDFADK